MKERSSKGSPRQRFGRLAALAMLLLIAACASTPFGREVPPDPTRAEIQASVRAALAEWMEKMGDQGLGDGIRTAVIAKFEPVQVRKTETDFFSEIFSNKDDKGETIGSEKRSYAAIPYDTWQKIIAEETSMELENYGALFSLWKQEKIEGVAKDADLEKLDELWQPSAQTAFYESTPQDDPIDALMLVKLTGTHEYDKENKDHVLYTLTVSLVDIRPQANAREKTGRYTWQHSFTAKKTKLLGGRGSPIVNVSPGAGSSGFGRGTDTLPGTKPPKGAGSGGNRFKENENTLPGSKPPKGSGEGGNQPPQSESIQPESKPPDGPGAGGNRPLRRSAWSLPPR